MPSVDPENPDTEWGYGYQWWIYRPEDPNMPLMFRTSGWGGQTALIVPDLGLAGAFTGWNVYGDVDVASATSLFYDRIVVPTTQAGDD